VDNTFHLSDPHRFNKIVQYDEENGLFLKPRSVKVENLFLSNQVQGNPIRDFLGYNFNYKVLELSHWSGSCQEVKASTNSELKTSLESISNLLALSTFLGITDLHSENIKLLEINKQLILVPIDIETILFKCESAIDTALIPSKIATEKFGFKQFNSNLLLNVSPLEFIDHFYERSIFLIKTIKKFWRFLIENISNMPIRIIIKPTLEYYSELSGHKTLNSFFSEENFQLQNNDIPYFFTYLGDNNIYYFDTPNTYKKVDTPEYSNSNKYIFNRESDFLNIERLQALLELSLLQIVNIYKEKLSKVTKTKYFTITCTDSNLSIEGPDFIIESDI